MTIEEISDHVDASPEVLRDHYDQPTADEIRDRQFKMMNKFEDMDD